MMNPWLQGSWNQSLGWNQQQMWQGQQGLWQQMYGGSQQDLYLAQANLRDAQTRYYQLSLQMLSMGGGMYGGGLPWWMSYGVGGGGGFRTGATTPIGGSTGGTATGPIGTPVAPNTQQQSGSGTTY
jgi:hypothetical protein